MVEIEYTEGGNAIIPEEVFVQAEKNGVSRKNVRQRINSYLWTAEEAATTPTGESKDPFRRLAKQNGISHRIYSKRVRLGWSPERAATEPVNEKGFRRDQNG